MPILNKKMLRNVRLDKNTAIKDKLNLSVPFEKFVENMNSLLLWCNKVNNFENIKLCPVSSRFGNNITLTLYGDRMETDEELAERQKRADGISKAKQKKLDEQKQKDLQVLKQLQEQYGQNLENLLKYTEGNNNVN